MNNINLYIAFLSVVSLLSFNPLNAQTDGAASWTGGGSDNNWSNPDNWTTASYPSGSSTTVLIGDASQGSASYVATINLDVDITLKQLKMGGGVPTAHNQTISGTNTMTLEGTGISNVVQINKNNGVFTFDCNVTIDSTNGATKNVQLNSSGTCGVVFSDGKTLTLEDHFGIIFKSNNSNQSYATFAGTISSTLTKDLIMKNYGNATFASTVDMTNFAGDLSTSGGNTVVGTKIQGAVKCRQLTLANSHNVTIESGGSVTVTSSVVTTGSTNGGTAKVVVEAGRTGSGAFIANNAGNNGETLPTVRLEKTTERLNQNSAREWTLLGIPVDGWTSTNIQSSTAANGSKEAIGHFDNSTGQWVTYNADAGTALTPGKGYHASPDDLDDNVIPIEGTLVDEGFMQTTINDQAGTHGNWNLIGNPYPAYMRLNDQDTGDSSDDQDDFLSDNAGNIHNTYEAIYSWDGEQYVPHNSAGSGKNYVAPGEGFFVYVRDTSDDGSNLNINFREAYLATNKGANFNAAVVQGGESSKNEAKIKVKVLNLEDNKSDYAYINFTKNSTQGLDPGYDLGKFTMGSGPKISTRLVEDDEGYPLVYQYLSHSNINDAVVPLEISSKTPALKLSIVESSLGELTNLYIEDRLNNTIVKFNQPIDIDLGSELNSYGRFYLHFTDDLIPELPTDNDLRIFKNSNSDLTIMGSPSKSYKAKIYDYSGRLVKEVNFRHKTNVNELDSKMKILRIESEEGLTIKKFKLN